MVLQVPFFSLSICLFFKVSSIRSTVSSSGSTRAAITAFSYAVEAVRTIIGMTVQAYGEENAVIAARVEPLEETVDLMEDVYKRQM